MLQEFAKIQTGIVFLISKFPYLSYDAYSRWRFVHINHAVSTQIDHIDRNWRQKHI